MACTSNVYSAEPAFPVLADSLLPQPNSTNQSVSSSKETTQNDWSLKNDWIQGLKYSKESIFRCGVVLGFSRVRRRSQESHEYIAQIPRHLLTTHLRGMHFPSSANAFIIYPGNFEAFAPRILLNELQAPSHGKPGLSRDEAIQRLESVQLLPVHNFPNAAQAIGKVSDDLHKIQDSRARKQQEEPTEQSPSSASPIVLIVVGLDTLTEGVVRASNPARGAAVLTATLRTLTRLSRVHAAYLSVILVNTNGVGYVNAEREIGSTASHGEVSARQLLEDGIHSIFHSDILTMFPTLLMKTLDQGIDTHLLISDIKGDQIVEVIKDRVGTGLGKWGIWNEH